MATPSRSADRIHVVESVVLVRGVSHLYRSTHALDGLDIEVPSGCMVGLIGPDGVGKSTLMGLIAGSKRIQTGEVRVLGGDMNDAKHREAVCPRIAYMPQGLGKNLYFELSVFENIDFFARLFGVSNAEREPRIKALLNATGLGPFPDRPAGKLSGGMKQKVGLCGALIHDPDLLILDEPTTGVDPLSRQQFWNLIDHIREQRPGMSVLVSTAYMDEAQRFDWTIAMDAGRVIATGTPAQLMERTGANNLEEAFVALLPGAEEGGRRALVIPPRVDPGGVPAIQATDLTKRFGNFTAVNRVSFTIGRGEIFGFLGSNGCGKSTTMKMLTGLLPATEGEAKLFGEPVDANDLATRNRVGYMSQAFSLYGELTVRQNLDLHAKIFNLPRDRARARIDELVDRFGLRRHLDAPSEELPLGLKQRLSLAVAVLHEPDMLLLDEPTSGVDPVARDEFWELLIDLSRRQGVTIFVSTHFMNEALRCDRISLMHAGTVLACDTPARLMAERDTDDLESAFIGFIADAEAARQEQAGTPPRVDAKQGGRESGTAPKTPSVSSSETLAHPTRSGLSLGRMLAYSRREAQEIERDPVRLLFAFLGSALMMLAFGFGITTDVENIRFAYLDLDQSPASRSYLSTFEGSRYFVRHAPAQTQEELQLRLKSHEIEVALEVEPNFGRNLGKGDVGEITAWVDGAPTNRAESLRQYLVGVHKTFLEEQRAEQPPRLPQPGRGRDRDPLRLQPDVRERLRHRTERAGHPADPDPGDPHGGERRPREGAGIHHQLLRHTDPPARVPGGQAVAVHRHRHDQLRGAAADRDRRVRGPAQGQRLDAHDLHAALRDGHHGRRHARLHVHLEPGRRRLHHRDPHDPADHPVLGSASAGLDPGRQRPGLRDLVANHLLHARQCWRLHQRPGGRRPADGRPRPGRLHPGPHRSERRGPAPPGEIA